MLQEDPDSVMEPAPVLKSALTFVSAPKQINNIIFKDIQEVFPIFFPPSLVQTVIPARKIVSNGPSQPQTIQLRSNKIYRKPTMGFRFFK